MCCTLRLCTMSCAKKTSSFDQKYIASAPRRKNPSRHFISVPMPSTHVLQKTRTRSVFLDYNFPFPIHTYMCMCINIYIYVYWDGSFHVLAQKLAKNVPFCSACPYSMRRRMREGLGRPIREYRGAYVAARNVPITTKENSHFPSPATLLLVNCLSHVTPQTQERYTQKGTSFTDLSVPYGPAEPRSRFGWGSKEGIFFSFRRNEWPNEFIYLRFYICVYRLFNTDKPWSRFLKHSSAGSSVTLLQYPRSPWPQPFFAFFFALLSSRYCHERHFCG